MLFNYKRYLSLLLLVTGIAHANSISINSGGAATYKSAVADVASLPATGNTAGDTRVVLSPISFYGWDGASWQDLGGGGGGSGITSLNGLVAASQTFVTGVAGTNFAISSAGSVHTFNLPVASAVNTGKLSAADWAIFNAKEPAITATTAADYYRGDKTFQPLAAAARAATVAASIVDGDLLHSPDGNSVFDALALKQNLLVNSAGLAAALSDETGTGLSVFSASPALSGVPTAPTATLGTNTTQVATTAFVEQEIAAIPGGGDVVGPASSADSQVALFDLTTGKLLKASTDSGLGILTSGVLSSLPVGSDGDIVVSSSGAFITFAFDSLFGSSFGTRTTDNLTEGATNLYYANSLVVAGVLTGTISNGDTTHAPNGDSVFDALALKQNLLVNSAGLAAALSDETGTGLSVFNASPALTGNPTAPTQTAADNSTKIATTAYADASSAAASSASIVQTITNGDTTHASSSDALFDALALKQDLLVNSAGLAAALSDETGTGVSVFSISPALAGNPTAPTQTVGDNSTRLATTAFVQAAIVTSVVNGGNTAYSILSSDGHVRSGTTLTADRTYTLPACTTNIGEKHDIKNLPAQTFNIILAGNGGDVIDGLASKTINPGSSVPVICAASGVWDVQ